MDLSHLVSPIRTSIDARDVAPIVLQKTAEDCADYRALADIGIVFPDAGLRDMMDAQRRVGVGMDDLQGTITTGSISTPVQFLQNWLPGFVNVITQVRNIDRLIGIQTTGSWEDEEVVQGILENTGKAQPYGDINNVPLANYNTNYERRTYVRFELGFANNRLADLRAAKARINSPQNMRNSVALALEIQRNAVGFYGYNSGANRTYGFLNDPNLPNYVNVANPGGGTAWSTKTALQILADVRTAVSALLTRSGGNIDATKVPTTLAVSLSSFSFLQTITEYNVSVMETLKKLYPQMRIESAPQLDAANSTANVFYLYADSYQDGSDDDGRVFIQPVSTKSIMLGLHQTAKGYVEDYSNGTAGAMLKRPYAVVRYSGI